MKDKIRHILRNINEDVRAYPDSDGDTENWDRVKIACTNDRNQEVGYAILDVHMDVANYMNYDDVDADYIDPDIGRHFPHGNAAKLEHLEVFHEYRGDKTNRYGSQLMDGVVKYCKQKNIKTIFLNASPIGQFPRISTDDLVNFYKKFGFQVIKVGATHDMVSQVSETQVSETQGVLDEDYSEQDELQTLANEIYLAISGALAKSALISKSTYFRLPFFQNIFLGNFFIKREYTKLKNFINDYELGLLIVDKNTIDAKGIFGQIDADTGRITMGIDMGRLKSTVERDILPNVDPALGYSEIVLMTAELEQYKKDVYFGIYSNQFFSTLLHELQHAYDSWRSEAKFLNTKSGVNYRNKYSNNVMGDEKQKLIYLKQQHEINARFAQMIAQVSFFELNLGDDKSKPMDYRVMLDFKEVLDEFKRSFVGYEEMTPKTKERLLNRLYKMYEGAKIEVEKKNQIALAKKRG